MLRGIMDTQTDGRTNKHTKEAEDVATNKQTI